MLKLLVILAVMMITVDVDAQQFDPTNRRATTMLSLLLEARKSRIAQRQNNDVIIQVGLLNFMELGVASGRSELSQTQTKGGPACEPQRKKRRRLIGRRR